MDKVEEIEPAVGVFFRNRYYKAQICPHHLGFCAVSLAHIDAHFLYQIYKFRRVEPVGLAYLVETFLDLLGIAYLGLFADSLYCAQFVLAVFDFAYDRRQPVQKFFKYFKLKF